MDVETLLTKNAILTRQLDSAILSINSYERQLEEKDSIISIIESKLNEAKQDTEQMRAVMTKVITDSNAKVNGNVNTIQLLNQKIIELKEVINGNKR